jgi:aminoglycoside phosphotransferase (APT) family kinase protein
MRPPLAEPVRAALGSPVTIRELPGSPRSRVWLVEFDGEPAVVKQIVGSPDAGRRHAREETALRLAGRARPPVVPAVLASDPGERVLVLEYLTGQRPGGEWMTDYASALARLHACGGPADAGVLPAWAGPGPADVQAFTGLAQRLGAPVPPGLADELRDLVARLAPAAGHALLHGDPCPDNAVHTAGGMRFIDLEQAALGHGETELAYLRIGWPTCWCATSVPGPVLGQAEAAYRSAWRSATGTDPEMSLADACAGWLIRGDALVERAMRDGSMHLARLPREDWEWGTATARQRLLHRLDVVAGLADGRPDLSCLAEVSRSMHDRIRRDWPGTPELPVALGDPVSVWDGARSAGG